MPFGETPFSIEDLKVALLTGDTPGTNSDILGIINFSLQPESDSEELRGDNTVRYTETFGKKITGSYEWGAYQAAALAIVEGGTSATAGTTPNQIITYTMSGTPATSYYQITAQAPASDGGGFRVTALKNKTTGGPALELADGSFSTPNCDYEGVSKLGNLATLANYETKVVIS